MNDRQRIRYRSEAKHAGRVLAVSEAVRRYCIESEGIAPEKVQTLVNGIDTERFRPLAPGETVRVREGLGLAAGEAMVLFVGRFTDQKAPQAFVRFMVAIRTAGLPARGFMCGKGPLVPEVEALISARDCGTTYLGLREDVPDLLAAADLFVSTSRNEGLPLNVMEAMASGTPFVAPSIPQIRELVDGSPHTSQLFTPPPPGEVPSGQVREWVETASALLAAPDRLRAAGFGGRRIIEDRFSLRSMVAAHEELYESLCRKSSP